MLLPYCSLPDVTIPQNLLRVIEYYKHIFKKKLKYDMSPYSYLPMNAREILTFTWDLESELLCVSGGWLQVPLLPNLY